MRLVSILFALMLVMGVSFMGNTFISSGSAIAEEEATEAQKAGDEMTNEATDDSGAEMDDADEATEGELPGDEMSDEAEDDTDATMGGTDESAEGEMPGGDMQDDATK
jgi:hypothetical protein